MGQTSGKEKGESSNQSVDGGFLIPQGVYSSVQDYDHGVVRQYIQSRKLAPFYPGLDDEEAYAQAPYNTECPICFLHYPSPLNQTRCCGQQICTECFVQIKRADPNHTNPPSSEPSACPYCQETNFGIVYKAPPPGVMTGEVKSAAGVAEGADAVRERAEESVEGSHALSHRRKSFGHRDPDVITIDAIRPDWQAKLAAAHAATTRRANRRIIMRQVGDRLIPVGVSSSRLGSELPAGSTAGPGGAIIIGENTRWGGGLLSSVAGQERRGSRNRRDLAQILHGLGDGGADMEEIMMMEAMRLSLLEHEEEQRRQAQNQSRAESEIASVPSTAPARTTEHNVPQLSSSQRNTPAQMHSAPITSSQGSMQSQQTQPRTSSLNAENQTSAPSALRSSFNPQDLGLSSAMMAELAELVDGGLPGVSSPAASASTMETAPQPILARAQPVPVPAAFAPSSPAAASTPPQLERTPVGSPSRVGTNPNNPFRRGPGSGTNTPTHSRQGSALQSSWTGDSSNPSRSPS